MHLADPIFIFILALVLLGPKRAGEMAHQIGKLMAEFRKASNDFKFQFNEEMRVAEQQDRQKKQEAERSLPEVEGVAALPAPASELEPASENSILAGAARYSVTEPAADGPEGRETAPDNTEAVPYAVSAISATTGEEHPIEDHPLLRVDVIPPMDSSPADQTAATAVTGREDQHG